MMTLVDNGWQWVLLRNGSIYGFGTWHISYGIAEKSNKLQGITLLRLRILVSSHYKAERQCRVDSNSAIIPISIIKIIMWPPSPPARSEPDLRSLATANLPNLHQHSAASAGSFQAMGPSSSENRLRRCCRPVTSVEWADKWGCCG